MAVMDYTGDETANDVDNPNPDQSWNADGRAGNDDLTGGTAGDLLIGGDNDDILTGGAGDDKLDGDGAYVPVSDPGGPPSKTAYYSGSDTLYGEAGDDIIAGGLGDDFLYGGADNDILGDGYNLTEYDVTLGTYIEYDEPQGQDFPPPVDNDTLDGGDGDDIIVSSSGADIIIGGDGLDQLAIFRGSLGPFVNNTSYNIDIVNRDGLDIGDGTTISGIEQIAAQTGDGIDTLAGGALADVLAAGSGNDFLYGRGGSDDLDGEMGADLMDGGAGDDTYAVDNSGDVIIELRGGGVDSVESTIDYNAQVRGDVFIENITIFGGAIAATGNALNNTIIGNEGDNVLNGYKGADTMSGGGGADIYVVDNVGDTALELADAGIDRVNSAVDHTLGDNVENLTLLGGGDIDGTGNGLLNRIVGNGGDNMIAGAGGVDILTGGAGQDTFVYETVADSTFGRYDRIVDFSGDDTVDVEAIDANSLMDGNQNFLLVDAFTGQAGQMTIDFDDVNQFTVVAGDIDGDGVGDFRIFLLGGDKTGFLENGGLVGAFEVLDA